MADNVPDWKSKRYLELPLAQMTRDEKIEELYTALERLWSGGGGTIYTVANERIRLRAILFDLLGHT